MENREQPLNMIDWWKKVVLENYANFDGRARRAEYWNYALANFLLMLVPYVLFMIFGAVSGSSSIALIGLFIYAIIALGTFIPSLAVGVRRLHDLGKSGWYYFIALIPFVGGIILLVWFFTDGNRFTNMYGEDPKNLGEQQFDFEQTKTV